MRDLTFEKRIFIPSFTAIVGYYTHSYLTRRTGASVTSETQASVTPPSLFHRDNHTQFYHTSAVNMYQLFSLAAKSTPLRATECRSGVPRGPAPPQAASTPPPMPDLCQYGFRARTARVLHQSEQDGEVPKGAITRTKENFRRELAGLKLFARDLVPARLQPAAWAEEERTSRLEEDIASASMELEELDNPAMMGSICDPLERERVRAALGQLKLSNDAVYQRDLKREKERSANGTEPPAPIRAIYFALCVVLDVLYQGRPIQKFWTLEVVARLPYVAYVSVLHLYESLGWWRGGSRLREVHFAEELTELEHLKIMESLGGDQWWFDRFVAQHAAVFYYWILVVTYLLDPKVAYQFSELVEGHATDTYEEFIEANEELLKSLPAPQCAVQYYTRRDMYLFDAFMTDTAPGTRRPVCETLYDTFVNIRDDEVEHEKTMVSCQEPEKIAAKIGRLPEIRS